MIIGKAKQKMTAITYNVPGTTPLVAMALIDMVVSKVCVERSMTMEQWET